jgi:L-threonylcarbamoyladenylate synthase
VFRQVLRALGKPLAAPSANRFGRISPTSARAVVDELGGRIPLVVDGGACAWGLESTIVRPGPAGPGGKPVLNVLRTGPVTVEELKKFGRVVVSAAVASPGRPAEAPGQSASHYAPRTPLRLLASPGDFRPEPGRRYALLSFRGDPADGFLGLADWAGVAVLSPGAGKLAEAAVRLFYALRQLDASGADEIVAEPVPERGLGRAVMDRLRRASA